MSSLYESEVVLWEIEISIGTCRRLRADDGALGNDLGESTIGDNCPTGQNLRVQQLLEPERMGGLDERFRSVVLKN